MLHVPKPATAPWSLYCLLYTSKEAVKKARVKGVKLGLIRLVTAWPFPEKAFAEISKECKGILVVEMSIKGQTVPDVKLATKCGLSVYGYFSVDRCV